MPSKKTKSKPEASRRRLDRCSVSYCLYGKNAGGEWRQIENPYKSQGDAEDAMRDYEDTFATCDGWRGFCIVRRTVVEETISPNPVVRGATESRTSPPPCSAGDQT